MRVRQTKSVSPIISAIVERITTSCTYWIEKLPIVNAVRKSSPIPELSGRRLKVSYERGFGLQRRTAVCCRKKETPIALIKGAIRGAFRSGR